MDQKFKVFWHNNKAHLSENGQKSFCGEYVKHSNGWTCDQDATITEFIKTVRPRCSGCLQGARVHQLLDN